MLFLSLFCVFRVFSRYLFWRHVVPLFGPSCDSFLSRMGIFFRTSCAFTSACATSDMQNYFFQTFAWKRKKCTIHVGRGFPEKWYMFDVPKPRKIYSTCKEVPGPHFLRGAVNLDRHSLDLMGLPSYIFSPTPISTSSYFQICSWLPLR